MVAWALTGTGCFEEVRKNRHLKRGAQYFQKHQYDRAELEYLNVVRFDRNQPVALERLGTIYYEQGRTREAFALLSRTKQLQPTNAVARIKLARLQQWSGQLEAARAEAMSVLEVDPSNSEALLIISETSLTPAQSEEGSQMLQHAQTQSKHSAALRVAAGNFALRRGELAAAERDYTEARSAEPQSAAAHLALANLRWRQGDLVQADQAFAAAVQAAPEDWAVQLQWASFKLQTGALAEARKIIEDIVAKNPRHVTAQLYLARLALAERRLDDCTALTTRLLNQAPNHVEARLLRGQLSMAKGDSAQAIAEFKQLRTEYPQVAQFSYHLALAQIEAKAWDAAAASLEQALEADSNFPEASLVLAELNVTRRGNHAVAIKALTNLLERFPKLERAYALLADAHRAQGQLNDGLEACRRWKEAVPKSPRPSYVSGLIYRQLQNPADARSAFEESERLAPGFLPPVEQLAELDLREQKPELAVSRVQRLVAANSNAPAPWLLLGKVQMARSASGEAEQALRQAAKLDTNGTSPEMLLAQLYLRQNKRDQALESLRTVLDRNPNDTTALLLTAQAQAEGKEYAKARETYEKLLKLEPKSVAALNNLAYLCVENLKDTDAGYKYAQQAYQLAPQQPSVADTLGWALCHRNEFALALPLLREAAQKRSSDPEVQFHLGTAYYMTAQEAPALAALQAALDLKPEFPGRDVAAQRLWTLRCDPQTAGPAEVTKLDQALAADPKDVFALLRRAAIADREAGYEQAVTLYRRALEICPKSTDILLQVARLYAERLQNPARALEHAKAAADLAPDDPQIAVTAGRIACRAGDYKRAYRLLRSTSVPTASPEVQLDLALAAYHLGRVRESLEIARRVAAAPDPFPRREEVQRFIVLVDAGERPSEIEKVRTQAEQALRGDAKYVPALMVLGMLQERAGRYAEARSIYEDQVLTVSPEFAPAWRRLVSLYADPLRDDFKALAAGNKAREVYGDDPELLKLMGKAAFRRKEYAQALQLLTVSSRGLSQDADVFYHLGLVCHQLNRKDQSKSALEKALALNLDGESATEAKRILTALK